MSPQVQRQQPPYLQIAEHLRDQINRGQLRDGDRLPSTRQIVRDWNVSHATAHRVIETLRSEGLARTVPGRGGGTFVDVREVGHSPQHRLKAVTRWGKIYPENEYARILAAELVTAPDRIAEALGVQRGSQVIRRHRVTYRDDAPVSMSTSWFAGDLAHVAPALLMRERIRQGTFGYVAERTGRRLRYGLDQFTALRAPDDVAAELGCEPGEPIIAGRNWARDPDGEAIEFGEYFSVPGRWQTYEYELG